MGYGAKYAEVEKPGEEARPRLAEMRTRVEGFCLTPREVKAHLDRVVIAQDEAKKALAVAICNHYNHVRRCLEDATLADRHHLKPNVLLLGPSGSGKTHLMRAAAELLGVPFVRADATRFSATGYIGADAEETVRQLLPAANGDLALAEFGVVYIDEVDKLAQGPGGGGHERGGVNTREVQASLLKLMEDGVVPLTPGPGRGAVRGPPAPAGGPSASLRTRHILFVFSGAFSSCESPPVSSEDFVRAGLCAEFIGRIPVRVALQQLTDHDLLRARDNVVEQLQADFGAYGIELHLTRGALEVVASRAASQGTGARGLMTILEAALRPFNFQLPSTSITRLEVDDAMIREPEKALAKLMAKELSILGLATTVPGMVGVEAGNVVDKDLVEVREATVEADEDARA
ncbi:putative ATP-dependent protease Clp, ATPase subunit [Emiliania huxleyi CCMP1516]|nr:putative ATP-dependent protease Clp, ATPase subunit [Emiliania huxleyi CCMP1516]EOD21382.1 putative ATP-dependent protease Clp, ATPase subunit [Emiliania huxleyi CCMP1516]|eukprot:XP_005773811.1 putative ATP-dependent protease Clp, ATPase subunit [Emiliania huxleyi CCMP1516]